MEAMLQYRSVGYTAFFRNDNASIDFSEIRVDGNFYRLSQTIALVPQTYPYVGFAPVTYALIRPIPRVLWRDKPIDPGYSLAGMLGRTDLSLTHSIVGELYMMDGLFAVFIGGLLLGQIAGLWSKLLDAPGGIGKPLTYGIGAMVLFAGLRSTQDLIIMSYGLLGWVVIAKLVGRVRGRRLVKDRRKKVVF
jgi:hypothetical protein